MAADEIPQGCFVAMIPPGAGEVLFALRAEHWEPLRIGQKSGNINLINHQPIQAKDTNADLIIYRSASTQDDISASPLFSIVAVTVI